VPRPIQQRLREYSGECKVSYGRYLHILNELSVTGDYDTVEARVDRSIGGTDIELDLVRYPGTGQRNIYRQPDDSFRHAAKRIPCLFWKNRSMHGIC